MTDEEPWTVHIAGPVIGPVQSCGTCGATLVDNTPWYEGRVAVMDGDEGGPGGGRQAAGSRSWAGAQR